MWPTTHRKIRTNVASENPTSGASPPRKASGLRARSDAYLVAEHPINLTRHLLKAIKDGKKNLAEIYASIKPLVEDEAGGRT